MEETPQLIGGFKQKFEQFVGLYKKLKQENEELKNKNKELLFSVKVKEEEIKDLLEKLETNDLAKTFLASSHNQHDAKLKINKIVREIDNCIALLNR
jgi:hypothetical protein